jgi:hypothetical protein
VNTAPYGFRILGGTSNERRLVLAAAAFDACASCDPKAELHKEQYLSAFQFSGEFRAFLAERGSVAGFAGPCWAPWIWFDIDREDDLQAALDDARRLAGFSLERYSLNDEAILAFFSGSKGFHLGLPSLLFGPQPSVEFCLVTRTFATSLAHRAKVRIDEGVFDRVRPFRAPNSRHPKTGLHKRRLTIEELMGLSLDRIVQLASEPTPFEVPAVAGAHRLATEDWKEAAEEAGRKRTVARTSLSNGPRINRQTLEIIRNGALVQVGDRHRLLYSSAANLAEFRTVGELAHALLTEPGLDMGLPPSVVRRQIDCGLKGEKPPAEAGGEESAAAAPLPDPVSPELLRLLWQSTPSPAIPSAPSRSSQPPEQPCEAGDNIAPAISFLFPNQNAGPYGSMEARP